MHLHYGVKHTKAAALFNITHRPDLITAGISTVIALHVLPLAHAFQNPLQYAPAATILACNTATPLTHPHTSAIPIARTTRSALCATAAMQLNMSRVSESRICPVDQ